MRASAHFSPKIDFFCKSIAFYQQKLDFYENGYLKIPGVVSPLMINAALHAINYSLGEEGMNKDDLPTLRAQSYCKEIRKSPAVTDLANKSAVSRCWVKAT